MRLYSACGTRRLTSTTMVFCILVETTSPTFSFLIPFWASVPAMLFLSSGKFPLAKERIDARAVFPHGAHLLQPVHLSHRHLKLQTEKLLVHFRQLVL